MTSPGCGEEHVPFGLCLTLIFHNMTFPWGSLCIHWKSRVSYLDCEIIQLYFLLHLFFAASFTLGTINESITFILPQSETSLMMPHVSYLYVVSYQCIVSYYSILIFDFVISISISILLPWHIKITLVLTIWLTNSLAKKELDMEQVLFM